MSSFIDSIKYIFNTCDVLGYTSVVIPAFCYRRHILLFAIALLGTFLVYFNHLLKEAAPNAVPFIVFIFAIVASIPPYTSLVGRDKPLRIQ